MVNVFAVPVFFICFRETLETSIIVSVLLSFLKHTLKPGSDPEVQTTYKKLVRHIWLGVALGILICVVIGAGLIGVFYSLGRKSFESAEHVWEGVFALLASIIITIMGAALLRISKMKTKWRVKIINALEKRDRAAMSAGGRIQRWMEKYAMFVLPFVTVLREGLEAVLFIGGVGLGLPASAFPLAVIVGLAAGAAVGFAMYKGANRFALQIFLIISTCFLYLVAAGLFTRSIQEFEEDAWIKLVGEGAAESGSGPGSYDIRKTVWHQDCCAPGVNGWGIFNALFGWSNTGTYGSVIGYNFYWIAIIVGFLVMRYQEVHGRLPLIGKAKRGESSDSLESSGATEKGIVNVQEQTKGEMSESARLH